MTDSTSSPLHRSRNPGERARRSSAGSLFSAPLSALLCLVVIAQTSPAEANERRATLVQHGLDLLGMKEYSRAEGKFKEAERAGSDPCGECRLGLAMVYSRTQEWSKGEKAARAAVEMMEGFPSQYLAYGELGRIYFERGKKNASYFQQAEDAFRTALELSEKSENALFYLGWTQLKQSKNQEGLATLERFVDTYPENENVAFARRMIAKPRSATVPLLPAFDFRTLDGQSLSNEDFEGRVVLLDFWATWCGPCRQAFPFLESLVERHQKAPFELVSISVDADEFVLRDFLNEEKPTWPQIWDGRERWSNRALEVSEYPTYVLVGPDGEMLYRISGGGPGIERKLRRQIARAVRQAEKSQN